MLYGLRRIIFLAALLAGLGFASTSAAAPLFRDTVLSPGATRAVQAATAEWGGPTLATDGETVTIYFSSSYPVDPALAKQWADFMTSLVHGKELSFVSIHLAPLSEVQRVCGAQALACYNPAGGMIFAPAEDPVLGTSAKGILIHEYGHHIAESRLNPPFSSVDYGTKRWASYEGVCARTVSGELFPGAEDLRHYMLNPGEAFAESYRLLNEQRLGLPQEPWNIVTASLYPDATALGLLEDDILTPWTMNTAHRMSAKLTAKVRTRTFAVSAPYDGTLTVLPRQSGKAKVSVSLLTKGARVGTRAFMHAAGASLATTVCGQRAYNVRVKLVGKVKKTTKTTVTLTVSTP
jgi:hypothetical protein